MNHTEEDLRRAAKKRVADLFNINPDALAPELIFGVDLKASFVSDFKANEFDQLDYDIRDVADAEILREFASGALVVRTVGDYCEHMLRCYRSNPKEVVRVLSRNSPA